MSDANSNQIPERTRVRSSSFLSKPIFVFSILALLFALSFTIPSVTTLLRFQFLRHRFWIPSTGDASICLLWMAPFLSGGGYSSEAWSYISALHAYLKKHKNPFLKLAIQHHGDLENVDFWQGLPLEMRNLAIELHQAQCISPETIVVCHSEPGAWHPPLFETFPCPPTGYGGFKAVIGRTMFETDRVNAEHVRRCNKMDFVWVPTDFHVNTFKQSGVDPTKVRKLIQPVDFNFFDPFGVEPLDLAAIASLAIGQDELSLKKNHGFVFLSVFKWEYRKGWDVLLRAYLEEFSEDDEVALFLLTKAYHSDNDFANKIVEYVEKSQLVRPRNGWPSIYVIDGHIPQADLPRLYKAVNAFVLPSRGEGWGRPIVEAMAMMLPVIATNWSGQTEYLTDRNSYPLVVEGMSEVKEGPFKGHMWAEPRVDTLRLVMRRVKENPTEAMRKGKEGRVDMMTRFSPDVVAGEIVKQLEAIVKELR